TKISAPSDVADNNGENASAPPDLITERISFCPKMSLTIWASAGDPSFKSDTNRASLLSRPVFSGVSRSTNCVSSSGQRVMPGSYSASHVGQNILQFPLS